MLHVSYRFYIENSYMIGTSVFAIYWTGGPVANGDGTDGTGATVNGPVTLDGDGASVTDGARGAEDEQSVSLLLKMVKQKSTYWMHHSSLLV